MSHPSDAALSLHALMQGGNRGSDSRVRIRSSPHVVGGGATYAMMARTTFPFTSVKRKWRP
jgi:hypothetical protein